MESPLVLSPSKDDWKRAFVEREQEVQLAAGTTLLTIDDDLEIGQTLLQKNDYLENLVAELRENVSE